MKRIVSYAFMLALLSAPAFAEKNSQSLSIPEAVSVGSTQLPAGEYKVTWTGTGNDVKVTLQQKDTSRPAVGTFNAKMVDDKHVHNGYTVSRQNGVDQLEAIQLSKFSLVVGGSTSAGQ